MSDRPTAVMVAARPETNLKKPVNGMKTKMGGKMNSLQNGHSSFKAELSPGAYGETVEKTTDSEEEKEP